MKAIAWTNRLAWVKTSRQMKKEGIDAKVLPAALYGIEMSSPPERVVAQLAFA